MRDHRCVLVLFLAIVWSASYTTASVRARRMLCGDDVNPGQYPFFANLIVRFPHTLVSFHLPPPEIILYVVLVVHRENSEALSLIVEVE
uniref:Secreted protein n=1 Tax=Parascaris equorum TaxID=6256 RepID=A0A914R8S1_PAREQ